MFHGHKQYPSGFNGERIAMDGVQLMRPGDIVLILS